VLSGIRAIEWATFGNGPIIGVILETWEPGHQIEDRVAGDPSVYLAFKGWNKGPGGINLVFESSNRNKKSIRVDLKKEKGRELIHRLVGKSDVFYTNYRKSVAKRQGMD